MIFYTSKPLRGFGYAGFLTLLVTGTLMAQELPSSQVGGNAQPIQGNMQGQGSMQSVPNSNDSQSGSNSQNTDNSQNNGNTQNNDNSQDNTKPKDANGNPLQTAVPPTPLNPTGAANTPLIPQVGGNPYTTPLNGNPENQAPQYTTPTLYNTGVFNLSQVATNNALSQAFGGGPGSSFSEDQGASYSNPLIDRIRLGPFDLKASLTLSLVSDDNLTAGQGDTSSGGKLSDTSLGITPAVLLVYGNHEGQRGYASLVYSPTLTRYFHHSAENSDNQNVAFSATYPFQRLSLDVSEAYTQITGINQDVNARTTQTSSITRAGGTYAIDDKLGLSSHFQEIVTAYANGGGNGDEISSINNLLAYQFSDRITVGPEVNLGVEQPDGGGNQTFEQALISLHYLATDKITLSGQGGAEIRQSSSDNTFGNTSSDGGSTISPVFSAGIDYNPFDSTKLSLSGFQSLQASSGAGDQTVTNTGAGFSASQRIVQRFYLGFSIFYTHADYKASSGGTEITSGTASTNFTTTSQPNGSTQDNLVMRPSLSFSPTLWSSIALYYQYQDNESTAPGAGYRDNQMGVTISAQF